MDSQDATELLSTPLANVRETRMYRAFPEGADEMLEHRRRLTVTHRFDFSAKRGGGRRQADVGHHPLMVAAHRHASWVVWTNDLSGPLWPMLWTPPR